MIAFIRGKLADVQAGSVVLDAGGIGYRVHVPLSLLHRLPAPGNEVTLHTHLAVREDGFTLYGFWEQAELDFFLKLLSVSGVGPKGALAVLTIFPPAELGRIIASGDAASLTRVPGVGKKTAGRIILELKDRVGGPAAAQEAGHDGGGPAVDAVEALEALGYSAAEARKAVREALKNFEENTTAAELVRSALRLLVKK
ncbi:MAG: Holliday junction branch migration protein RuvA [Peptococcaceae bacterium]|nr:Holliday junction branch migration protein RuvA [Peptococcaceae bacterium]